MNKNDIVVGLSGFTASRDKLIAMNNKGLTMPFFIYTGYPDDMNIRDFEELYGKPYIKGNDNQKLLDAIKESVLNKEEFLVQSEHKQVFKVCDKYFDPSTRKHLTQILLSLKKPNQDFDDELYFTQVRIILESAFRVANKFGLLHDACAAGGKLNLTECSLFLAGEPTKHLKVSCKKRHFPKLIAEAVKNIIFITGAASHTIDPDIKNNLDLKDYRARLNTPYLLYSLSFQIMDILIWFDSYLSENDNYQENKSFWGDDMTEGKITKIENGYGTFLPNNETRTLSVFPKMIQKHGLIEGQKIKVKMEMKPFITDIEI